MVQIYQALATALTAKLNCEKSGNTDWRDIWSDRITNTICREKLPSGSGIDTGTSFSWGESNPERIVLLASFHHMDEHGGYDGWTEHKIIITPSLQFGFQLRITGRNRNDIKDYLGDVYHAALSEELGKWDA